MSVMKESATQHLINQIKSALAVGKIAMPDTELKTDSTNVVTNEAITSEIIKKATIYRNDGVVNNTRIVTYQKVGTGPLTLSANETRRIILKRLSTDMFPLSYTDSWLVYAHLRQDSYSETNGIILQNVGIGIADTNNQYCVFGDIVNTKNEEVNTVGFVDIVIFDVK